MLESTSAVVDDKAAWTASQVEMNAVFLDGRGKANLGVKWQRTETSCVRVFLLPGT